MGVDIWRGRLCGVAWTMALGAAAARVARVGDVIALDGELGVGKTRFVRGMAQALLGDDAAVASPTFVLVHEYGPIARGAAEGATLVHVDAYRIHSGADLETIGWTSAGGGELAEGAIVVVEWAGRVEAALGDKALRVSLEHAGEHERVFEMRGGGDWAKRMKGMRKDFEAVRFEGVMGEVSVMDENKEEQVTRRCPICRKPVREDAETFPFCGERCRTIDLGRWASEQYRVSRPIEHADLDEQ